MTLSSMLHSLFLPADRDSDVLAAIEQERLAAQAQRDAAVARLQRSTADLREMVAETVERIGNGHRRHGRH